MNPTNVLELFNYKLKKLYDTEKQLLTALPLLSAASTDEELGDNLDKHLEETREQARRLEHIAADTGVDLNGEQNQLLSTMISDNQKRLEQAPDRLMKDLCIATSCLEVEHMEVSLYQTAIALAHSMHDYGDVEHQLKDSLHEEEDAAKKLEKKIGDLAGDSSEKMDKQVEVDDSPEAVQNDAPSAADVAADDAVEVNDWDKLDE